MNEYFTVTNLIISEIPCHKLVGARTRRQDCQLNVTIYDIKVPIFYNKYILFNIVAKYEYKIVEFFPSATLEMKRHVRSANAA